MVRSAVLRGDPVRVDIPGYTPRVVATADRIFVLVVAEIERTAAGLRRPRRLYAFDWSGRPLWTRDLDQGPAGPRVAADGLLWFAEPAALVGLNADGAEVRRIDLVLPPNERLGAFVGLADGGFIIATEAKGGRRGPRGRVLRLDRAGALRWSRELMPDPRSPRAAADPPHRSLWRPENWVCVHHHPLLVAGDAVLCGFQEWPRSGLGRRYLLGLARGEPRWTGELGAIGHAAIVGPGTFLAGALGYGQLCSVLVGRGGVLDRWDTHGPGPRHRPPACRRVAQRDALGSAHCHPAARRHARPG